MHARGPVGPHGGEEGELDAELVEERAAGPGQLGRRRGEVLPRGGAAIAAHNGLTGRHSSQRKVPALASTVGSPR